MPFQVIKPQNQFQVCPHARQAHQTNSRSDNTPFQTSKPIHALPARFFNPPTTQNSLPSRLFRPPNQFPACQHAFSDLQTSFQPADTPFQPLNTPKLAVATPFYPSTPKSTQISSLAKPFAFPSRPFAPSRLRVRLLPWPLSCLSFPTSPHLPPKIFYPPHWKSHIIPDRRNTAVTNS